MFWKVLKECVNSNECKPRLIKYWFKNEYDDCYSGYYSDFVANTCNDYMCNIAAEKLVDKLPLRTYREDRLED